MTERVSLAPSVFGTLAVCAVRYALGRRTYITGEVANIVTMYLDLLPENDQRVILRDINACPDRGDECDRAAWQSLAEALCRELPRARRARAALSDEVSAVDPIAPERPPEDLRAAQEALPRLAVQALVAKIHAWQADGSHTDAAVDLLRQVAALLVSRPQRQEEEETTTHDDDHPRGPSGAVPSATGSPRSPQLDSSQHDHALETAREVLDGCVCECGHLASSHVGAPVAGELTDCGGDFGDETCGCCEFTPVLFTVERA